MMELDISARCTAVKGGTLEALERWGVCLDLFVDVSHFWTLHRL